MVHSTTALGLFTAAAFLSTGVSAHLPGRDGLTGRSAHVAPHKRAAAAVADAARSLIPDMEKIRRSADDILARSTGSGSGSGSGSNKQKRRVKKRKNQCVPQQPFNVTSTSPSPSSTQSQSQSQSQSQIGNEHMATGTASSWSSATSAWSSAAAPAETSSSNGGGQQYNSLWNLEDTWAGNSFFDHWDFWNYNDPTHGVVDYVDAGTAVSVESFGSGS